MKLNTLIVLAALFVFAGCNYELKETGQESSNAAEANSNVNAADDSNAGAPVNAETAANSTSGSMLADKEKLILIETSQTAIYPCNGREVEITEEATANTLTLTGECKKLTVNGVSNQVFVEKIGEIVVMGVSNKVVYGSGIGGKKPKITKSGTSTSVEHQSEAKVKDAEAANQSTSSNAANK